MISYNNLLGSVFLCLCYYNICMKYIKKKLPISKELNKKIDNVCIYRNIKYEFHRGLILEIENTNISFIEPHQYHIKICDLTLILLSFDNNHIFLYNRYNLIDIAQLKAIIDSVKDNYC